MTTPNQYLLEDHEAKQKDYSLLKIAWSLISPYKIYAFSIVILMLASELLPLMAPMLLKSIVDGPLKILIGDPQNQTAFDEIILYASYIVLIMLGIGFLTYLKSIITQFLGQTVIYELRLKVFDHVLSLPLDFFKRTPTGRLMNRMTYDMDTLSSLFSEGLIDLIGSALMVVATIAFMFYMNPTLTCITLAFIPFMVLSSWAFSVKMRTISRELTGEMSKMTSQVHESIQGASLLQMYGKQKENFNKFEETNNRYKKTYIRYAFYFALFMPSLSIIIDIATIIVVAYGAYNIAYGDNTIMVGELVAFPWFLHLLFNPFREISDKYAQLQKSFAAAERIFYLLTIQSNIPLGSIKKIESPFSIKVKDLKFYYNQGEDILKGIDFELQHGKTMAVVGATGSGKSTLVNLLKKHYLPQSGQIEINNTPLIDIDTHALNQKVVFVPQDIFVFSDTIESNITLGRSVDQKRLDEVCEMTNAIKFIKNFKDGYQTKLEERGQSLSTGERQLLAFARALYQEPDLLILDEATSNIDTESELLIQDAIKNIMVKKTMIIIAHRLSTIMHVDEILVMQNGKITERGNHQQLFRQKGTYYKLCQMQFHLE